jgi:hypothetical protein
MLLGRDLNRRVRNVFGKSVDSLLARRLAKQDLSLVQFLVPSVVKDRVPALERYRSRMKVRNDPPSNTDPPWRKFATTANIRRMKDLPKRNAEENPVDLRTEEDARAWLSGIVGFKMTSEICMPTIQRYVGRMSNSSFCFVRRPPKVILRAFLSACIQGRVEYFNIFGSVRSNLSTDPLFQVARKEQQVLLQNKRRASVLEQIQHVNAGRRLNVTLRLPTSASLRTWTTLCNAALQAELCSLSLDSLE